MTAPVRPRCPDCGPGYRIGDDGCRHSGKRAEILELSIAERLQTSFAVDVVKARLVHDSACPCLTDLEGYPGNCTCDLAGTAGAILSAIGTWITGPSAEDFHSLVLMDLQIPAPDESAASPSSVSGPVAAHTSPATG